MVEQQNNPQNGLGLEGAFEVAGGEPAGEETFETRVGLVEPVEEDEAEVTYSLVLNPLCISNCSLRAGVQVSLHAAFILWVCGPCR